MDSSVPSEVPPSTAGYPVSVRNATGMVDGEQTEVSVHYFTDKILITISQKGRLAQWMSVPLEPAGPTRGQHYIPPRDDDEDALPMTHLTAHTLLGAPGSERETVGHLYATQIATAIATKDPDEDRTVLVGLGLVKAQPSREQFFDVFELVTQCL